MEELKKYRNISSLDDYRHVLTYCNSELLKKREMKVCLLKLSDSFQLRHSSRLTSAEPEKNSASSASSDLFIPHAAPSTSVVRTVKSSKKVYSDPVHSTQLNLRINEGPECSQKRKTKFHEQPLDPLKHSKTDDPKGYEKQEEMPCFTHSWKMENLHQQFSQLMFLQKDHHIQPEWHKTVILDTQNPKERKSAVKVQSGQLNKTLGQNQKNEKLDTKHISIGLQSYPQHDQNNKNQEQTNKMHTMHDLSGQEPLFKENRFENALTKQGHLIEMRDLFSPDPGTQEEPRIVVVHGAAAIGKSALARQVRQAWQQGRLYRDRFPYVFYISCRELARCKVMSLEKLIACGWGESVAPIGEILSQPEQLLFILDGVDEPKWILRDQNSELCWHWKHPLPVAELLGSLLRKTVLPGASFLITTRTTKLQKLIPSLAQPRWVEILGFSESGRKEYFYKYFTDERRAIIALSLVDSNSALWSLCLVPWVCWLVCTCLKQQLELGNEQPLNCQTTTALCLHYLSQIFSVQLRSSRLSAFCFLAAGGIWRRDTMIRATHLKEHQIGGNIIFTFLKTDILQKHSSWTYSFTQRCFQEFFAAVCLAVGNEDEREEHPSCIERMEKLLKRYGSYNFFQVPTLHFLFGLLSSEGTKKVENIFSCKVSPQWKWQLLQWAQAKAPTQPPYSLDFFRCLYEAQDEELLKSAMAHFQGTRMCIQTDMELLVFTFCVKFCSHVKQLQLHDGGHQAQASWSPGVARVKWSPLTNDNWKVFFSILGDTRSLKELDVSGNPLSLSALQYLCETLRHPRCYLEALRLASCGLTAECCKDLAISISTNHRLINLDLSFNMLTDAGAKRLCQKLGSPQSKLQRLQLAGCGLTSRCCQNLTSLLSSSPSLKELDLQQNDLSTHGVQQLFEGLRHPNCQLTLLCLDHNLQNEELIKELNVLKEEKHHLRIHSRWNPSVMVSPENQDGRTINNSTSSLQQKSQSGMHHTEPVETEYNFQGPTGPIPTEVVDQERGLFLVHCPMEGFYQCPSMGLSFAVKRKVTIEIEFCSWDQFLGKNELQNTWMVAGPLFDIKTEQGAVVAVHLPHFVAVQGETVDTSLFHVAHFKEEGMLLEKPSRVEPHHIVLENPSFSPMGILLKVISTARRFIPINCTTLLYQRLQPEDVRFHLYLIPSDCTIRKTIEDEEKKFQFTRIQKPLPMDPLYMGSHYTVSGSENLEIMPDVNSSFVCTLLRVKRYTWCKSVLGGFGTFPERGHWAEAEYKGPWGEEQCSKPVRQMLQRLQERKL